MARYEKCGLRGLMSRSFVPRTTSGTVPHYVPLVN